MPALLPRITEVRPILLRAPLEQPVRMAIGQMHWRNGLLLQIETDAGVSGLGESWVNFPAWAPTERVATITEGLRPLLLGEAVDDPRRLQRKLVDKLHRLALQWGAIGPIYQAMSGVDLALWDLAGKLAGVPVWQLLGAPRQETVPAYASGLGPENVGAHSAAAVASGFTAFKLKIGFDRARDEQNLATVREVIGNRSLFTDANQGWKLAEARAMAPLLREIDAGWIEEPLAVDDPDWDALGRAFPLPVAGGENLYSRRQFSEWTVRKRLQVLQPDICKCGGITAAHAILTDPEITQTRLAPHYFGGAIGLVATIHLFAALPADRRIMVEYDVNPNPLRDGLLNEPLLEGGRLRLPEGPGLGITLNQKALEKFRI